jgi:RNA polymerase sigma-70 factor (ECF subfamily)
VPETPHPIEPSDSELLARSQRGDEDAFGLLYHRYRDWCVRIARRFSPDEAAAWDATHDAFAWLLKKLPTLRLDGRLGSLLYPVVKNAAATAGRRNIMRLRHEDAAASSRPEPVGTERHNSEASLALQTALRSLPEPQRETLLMRAVDGMSMDEIALALGIPAGTVKSRLHHAREALKLRLGAGAPGRREPESRQGRVS